jgi:hypothetical protein
MTSWGRLVASKRATPAAPVTLTLEGLLTSPVGFRLPASPVQRAICRVIDGLPLGELADHPHVIQALGGEDAVARLREPREKPLEIYIIGGSRIGKTLLAAALLFKATQTIDTTGLGAGDEPRCPVLSLDKDKANACYTHLVNNVKAPGSSLAPYLLDEGRNELDAPAAWFRHPSGRAIQVCVTANKAAGNAVVSYFLGSVVFDEACKMAGAGDAVVNFEEARANALGRLLPGAQLVAIGSPWAPFGPMYDAFQSRFGKPGPDLVVIHARGDTTNPWWWTPAKVAKLDAKIRATEVEALFQTLEEALYDEGTIKACARPAGDLPRAKGLEYFATIDPATRSNAWTLAVGAFDGTRVLVACLRQWLPGEGAPLSPTAVFGEMAPLLRSYGVDCVTTDQWSTDALRELAGLQGISLVEQAWSADRKHECYGALATRFAERTIEIPLDPDCLDDLKRVKRRVTQEGISIVLPERKNTNGTKRHCDYVPTLASLQDKFPLIPQGEGKAQTDEEKEDQRLERWAENKRQAQADEEAGCWRDDDDV